MRDIDSIKNEMNRFLQHHRATGVDRIQDSYNSVALQSAKAAAGLSGIAAAQGPMFALLNAQQQRAADILRPYHDLLDSSIQTTMNALRAAAVGPVPSYAGLAQMPFDSSISAGFVKAADSLKLMENSTAFSIFGPTRMCFLF